MEGIVKALRVATEENVAAHTEERKVDAGTIGGALERRSQESAEFTYTATRVAKVSKARLERFRILTDSTRDPVTNAYKQLRTQVAQRLAREGWRTIAVVSPANGEGKTLTAINLGIALATAEQNTALLVDLDWRQPSVHTYFGLAPEHDVCSYLDGQQPLSAAMVNPGIPRFCFVPCRAPVANSSERLGGGAVRTLVEELKGRYRNRIVLFDLPPLLMTDDAVSFLPCADCALVVIEENRTPRAAISKTLELIGPNRLLGMVVNKSSQILSRY